MPKSSGFKKLEKAVREEYLGQKVPKEYQKRYGKIYTEEDVERLAYAIAESKKIRRHEKYINP